MPRIRFTADPKLPRDWADKPYRKDYEADMSDDEADRWLRRGVAVIVPDQPAEAQPIEAATSLSGPVEIPDDWQSQHHMARIALAKRLTDDPIDTAAAAHEVIAAETERRAASAPSE